MAFPTDFTGSKATDDTTSEDDPANSPSRDNQEAEGPVGEDGDEAKLTLSKEQLEAAGLTDLEPGDAFTVTLHGTVTDKGDANGITADIDELTDGMIDGTIPDAKPMPKPLPVGPKVKGPQEAGMLSSSPMLPDDTM